MGVGPLELSGGLTRTQDYAIMRHNEEHKGAVSQNNIIQSVAKESEERVSTVKMSDDVSGGNTEHDARNKGKGEYSGDGGRNRKENPSSGGKVLVKGPASGFDIRI